MDHPATFVGLRGSGLEGRPLPRGCWAGGVVALFGLLMGWRSPARTTLF